MVTENLECNQDGFVVYVADPDDNPDATSHFTGKRKILPLENSGTNNGQNECVFRHICEDNCHYVFLAVQNVPDESSWKICEALFH